MKGYYIYVDRPGDISIGVKNKILSQINQLNKEGLNCTLAPIKYSTSIIKKVCRRFLLGPDNAIWETEQYMDADYIYFRKNLLTYHFVLFLKNIKKNNPSCKIIIEIPTYPYDKEIIVNNPTNIPLLFRDYLTRHLIGKYVDYLLVIGVCKNRLWGIRTIKFFNGVDMNENVMREPKNSRDGIKIAFLANFQKYHGLDCLIKGLEKYYLSGGKENIVLYIAGKGDEYNKQKQYVEKKYILKNHVLFLGVQESEGRKKIYDECDLGVVSLAYARLGLEVNTTIKSKEYMAVGLPMIVDTPIDIVENDKDIQWIHRVRYGDKPVDFFDIVEYYHSIYNDSSIEKRKKIALEMRKYAEQNACEDKALDKVIEVLKVDEK